MYSKKLIQLYNKLAGNNNRRLYDAKLDGQHEYFSFWILSLSPFRYELTACLFGLGGSETNRTSVNRSATRELANEEIDYEILKSLEDVVDFDDYGLTDVFEFIFKTFPDLF